MLGVSLINEMRHVGEPERVDHLVVHGHGPRLELRHAHVVCKMLIPIRIEHFAAVGQRSAGDLVLGRGKEVEVRL